MTTERKQQIAKRIEAAIMACPEPWQLTAITQVIDREIEHMTQEGLIVPWRVAPGQRLVDPFEGLVGPTKENDDG